MGKTTRPRGPNRPPDRTPRLAPLFVLLSLTCEEEIFSAPCTVVVFDLLIVFFIELILKLEIE